MFELLKKIQDLIEAYRATNELTETEVKNVIDQWKDQVNKYKLEYIQEQIKQGVVEAQSNVGKVNEVYNQKLKAVIAASKEAILPGFIKDIKKAADYATQVNNALQFLTIEGDEITDEKAFMILKDFMNDLDQMKLFKNVIGKRVELEDSNGGTTFPKTFGKLNQVEVVLNTFNEIELIANMLFIYPKENGETYIVNGQGYSIPHDSYEQMAGEDDIITLATAIESIAKEVPGIEKVTDQTEHETV